MMNYYIQYHNADKLGTYPTQNIDFKTSVENLILDDSTKYGSQIYTSKKTVEKAVGQYCFLIVGKTEIVKKYYLWSMFKIEDYTKDQDGYYDVNGTGNDFKKPILLNDFQHFNEFKKFCGSFGLGFQNIDKSVFCSTLISLSSQEGLEISINTNQDNYSNLQLELKKLNEEMKNIEPEKRFTEIEQTLRKDTKIVELLKKVTNYKCQFPNCTSEVQTKNGLNYVEVAHIQPVHKGGQSILGNLIVLCPNHHKEFDYGNLEILKQADNVLNGILNGINFTIEQKNYS